MLLDGEQLSVASAIDEVLPKLPPPCASAPPPRPTPRPWSWPPGSGEELGRVRALLDSPGAQRQREAAGDGGDHHRLLCSLVQAFLAE